MGDSLKAFFVSDLHLGSGEEPHFILFKEWLSKLTEMGATHLFLVGDIFDLWIENHSYFKKKYENLINVLVHLKQSGVEIHYFEGNHDLYLKKFWQDQLGFFVHHEAEYFTLGPWKVRVEHGDQIDLEDRGYLFLRWFLRTPLMKLIAKHLPEQLVVKIGESASQKSRHYTSEIKTLSEEKSRRKLHEHARRVHTQQAFDWFVTGHTHYKEEYTFECNNKLIRAINLGTWLKEPLYFVLTPSGGHIFPIEKAIA